MNGGDAVFRSTGQALHVAFLMEILPPTQKVSTQLLIESLREQTGKVERRIASTINTAGISPLEFRGQCAMVRAAAADHLTTPEHGAIRARYGHQLTKSAGVQALAEYLAPIADLGHDLAMRAVVWGVYHKGSQRAKDRLSLSAIERETGITRHRLRKAQAIVIKHGEALEARAAATLGDLFARTGLVGNEG